MEAVPFIGIDRHRLGVDGVGVTTLAAFHGCSLHCRYCLNHRCLEAPDGLPRYTPQQLYDRVSIDNLYFIATGGGVCFGGGEPLLRVDFLTEFKALCGKSWNLTAETALQVPQESVRQASLVIGDFIVDIKESDPDTYRSYTGGGTTSNTCSLLLAPNMLSFASPSSPTTTMRPPPTAPPSASPIWASPASTASPTVQKIKINSVISI